VTKEDGLSNVITWSSNQTLGQPAGGSCY